MNNLAQTLKTHAIAFLKAKEKALQQNPKSDAERIALIKFYLNNEERNAA